MTVDTQVLIERKVRTLVDLLEETQESMDHLRYEIHALMRACETSRRTIYDFLG